MKHLPAYAKIHERVLLAESLRALLEQVQNAKFKAGDLAVGGVEADLTVAETWVRNAWEELERVLAR